MQSPQSTRAARAPGACLTLLAAAFAMTAPPAAAGERTAAQVYEAACAACHGLDGRGGAREIVGYDFELPDFSDCSFATREPDSDWLAVAHDGGPARAFDRRMPAFGEALPLADVQLAVSHLRSFCRERAWPRGELNLPRPLFTEKAFPEDEAVLTVNASDGTLGNELLYEKRLGSRGQFEIAAPIDFARDDAGRWQRGLGDVALGVKRTLLHGLERGAILSVGGEVVFATGRDDRGLGKGVSVFEPFVSFGKMLPRDGFVQLQAGAELPFDRGLASNEAVGSPGTELEFAL